MPKMRKRSARTIRERNRERRRKQNEMKTTNESHVPDFEDDTDLHIESHVPDFEDDTDLHKESHVPDFEDDTDLHKESRVPDFEDNTDLHKDDINLHEDDTNLHEDSNTDKIPTFYLDFHSVPNILASGIFNTRANANSILFEALSKPAHADKKKSNPTATTRTTRTTRTKRTTRTAEAVNNYFGFIHGGNQFSTGQHCQPGHATQTCTPALTMGQTIKDAVPEESTSKSPMETVPQMSKQLTKKNLQEFIAREIVAFLPDEHRNEITELKARAEKLKTAKDYWKRQACTIQKQHAEDDIATQRHSQRLKGTGALLQTKVNILTRSVGLQVQTQLPSSLPAASLTQPVQTYLILHQAAAKNITALRLTSPLHVLNPSPTSVKNIYVTVDEEASVPNISPTQLKVIDLSANEEVVNAQQEKAQNQQLLPQNILGLSGTTLTPIKNIPTVPTTIRPVTTLAEPVSQLNLPTSFLLDTTPTFVPITRSNLDAVMQHAEPNFVNNQAQPMQPVEPINSPKAQSIQLLQTILLQRGTTLLPVTTASAVLDPVSSTGITVSQLDLKSSTTTTTAAALPVNPQTSTAMPASQIPQNTPALAIPPATKNQLVNNSLKTANVNSPNQAS